MKLRRDTMTAESPIVELLDYSYLYPNSDVAALSHVSASINVGDFVGIIGANGAGKTTLCKSIAAILPYVVGGSWDGDITIATKSLKESGGAAASGIVGIVLQNAESQFTQQTVEDEIAFALCNFGYERPVMRKRVAFAAKACGLTEVLGRSPSQLSGGQQQRLAIACVLALQPQVMILDETTSQLDPEGRDAVFGLVDKMRREKKTVLMAEHDVERLAAYANKICVLDRGALVAFGPTAEVLGDVELLRAHHVRAPQVTDAAYRLREELPQIDRLPVDLVQAKKTFALWKGAVAHA
jgi:energy-coupling factor transport system ATP-binding protein